MKTYSTWALLLFMIMITGCKSSKNLSVNPVQEAETFHYLDFHHSHDSASYAAHTRWEKIPLEDRKVISEAFGRLKA